MYRAPDQQRASRAAYHRFSLRQVDPIRCRSERNVNRPVHQQRRSPGRDHPQPQREREKLRTVQVFLPKLNGIDTAGDSLSNGVDELVLSACEAAIGY
jgi:hypothetical protein